MKMDLHDFDDAAAGEDVDAHSDDDTQLPHSQTTLYVVGGRCESRHELHHVF